MKGCLSYEIVRRMKDGESPQAACDHAVYPFVENLRKRYGKAGEFSLVAMNNKGEWGVATNVEFTFCVASDKQEPVILMANPEENMKTKVESVSQEWLADYERRIHAPIE